MRETGGKTWQRQHSTISKERWSAQTWCTLLVSMPGTSQGLFRSFKKSAATLLSLPVFAVTDQYSRKVFNDLYFKRYKGSRKTGYGFLPMIFSCLC